MAGTRKASVIAAVFCVNALLKYWTAESISIIAKLIVAVVDHPTPNQMDANEWALWQGTACCSPPREVLQFFVCATRWRSARYDIFLNDSQNSVAKRDCRLRAS